MTTYLNCNLKLRWFCDGNVMGVYLFSGSTFEFSLQWLFYSMMYEESKTEANHWKSKCSQWEHLHYSSDHRKCFSHFHQWLSWPIKFGQSLFLLSAKFLTGVANGKICICYQDKIIQNFIVLDPKDKGLWNWA